MKKILKGNNLKELKKGLETIKKCRDGYGNKCICWIDNPVCMDVRKDMVSIQQFRNIFSIGIEVKYGTMVFDSPIYIITSNASARQAVLSTGEAVDLERYIP